MDVAGRTRDEISTARIVVASGNAAAGIATVLSVFFSLNILLGCFNLLPFPPLDGYGVLGLFVSEAGALKLQELRAKIGGFSIIGLLIGWRLLSAVYWPLLATGIHGVYAFYRFS
jgi:Zn-dependent protease